MSKKRILTFSSESKFVNLNKKTDLIISYFRRKSLKYKYYKHLLISLDLVQLISAYSKHVVIFDLYNKEKIKINENQHESVLKPNFMQYIIYSVSFRAHVLSSQKIETTHGFSIDLPQIQINENDDLFLFRFRVGIVSTIKTDLRDDILTLPKGYFLTFLYPSRDIRMVKLNANSQNIWSKSLAKLQPSMNNNAYIKKESCNEFKFSVNNKLVYNLIIENKQQSFYFCLSWNYHIGYNFLDFHKNIKQISWKVV